MGMAFASTLRMWLEEVLRSARIVSPRFTDYTIESLGYYNLPGDFDKTLEEEINIAIEKQKSKAKINKKTSEKKEAAADWDAKKLLNLGQQGLGGVGGAMGMLGRVLPPLAVALIVKQVSEMVLEELIKPGGLLDTRYKRKMLNEVENYLTRQQQRDTQVGKRQVIIQAQNRFLNLYGAGSSNTFQQIRDEGSRLAETGLHTRYTAKGVERFLP